MLTHARVSYRWRREVEELRRLQTILSANDPTVLRRELQRPSTLQTLVDACDPMGGGLHPLHLERAEYFDKLIASVTVEDALLAAESRYQ